MAGAAGCRLVHRRPAVEPVALADTPGTAGLLVLCRMDCWGLVSTREWPQNRWAVDTAKNVLGRTRIWEADHLSFLFDHWPRSGGAFVLFNRALGEI